MKRREFITLLGGAAAWPFAARAQQAAMPVIGYLGPSSFAKSAGTSLLAFKRGLAETGYVEERNVTIEYRWADDVYQRLPALALELVERRVAVLVAAGSPAALPAKVATTVIPTVFMIGSDPVVLGLVASLNRPGGNLTGVSYLNVEVAPKRLELLHEFVPAAKSIALLVNPANPAAAEEQAKELRAAVAALGLNLMLVLALRLVHVGQVVEGLGRIGVVCAKHFLLDRQLALVERLSVGVLGLDPHTTRARWPRVAATAGWSAAEPFSLIAERARRAARRRRIGLAQRSLWPGCRGLRPRSGWLAPSAFSLIASARL